MLLCVSVGRPTPPLVAKWLVDIRKTASPPVGTVRLSVHVVEEEFELLTGVPSTAPPPGGVTVLTRVNPPPLEKSSVILDGQLRVETRQVSPVFEEPSNLIMACCDPIVPIRLLIPIVASVPVAVPGGVLQVAQSRTSYTALVCVVGCSDEPRD